MKCMISQALQGSEGHMEVWCMISLLHALLIQFSGAAEQNANRCQKRLRNRFYSRIFLFILMLVCPAFHYINLAIQLRYYSFARVNFSQLPLGGNLFTSSTSETFANLISLRGVNDRLQKCFPFIMMELKTNFA
jgi:hypothetical protein